MDPLDPEVQRLFATREERRKQLAALPYPEKVRIVVQMQKMIAPILKARGIDVQVWDIGGEDTP
jgi:hypothetical protein